MTAGVVDFDCVQGEAFSGSVSVVNPDNEVASLTYWGSRMQIRRRFSSDSALIELSTDNGMITHDNENARISLYISAEDTSGLELGDHVYDLELYSTGSKNGVLRLIKGVFTVR